MSVEAVTRTLADAGVHVGEPSLVSEVDAALEELPTEMRDRWSRLLSETTS